MIHINLCEDILDLSSYKESKLLLYIIVVILILFMNIKSDDLLYYSLRFDSQKGLFDSIVCICTAVQPEVENCKNFKCNNYLFLAITRATLVPATLHLLSSNVCTSFIFGGFEARSKQKPPFNLS